MKPSHPERRAPVALILAGGQSRRMGSDKALLAWQSVPLLRRVGLVAAACCSQVFVLTPWPERYQSIAQPDWRFLLETQPGRGPLFALAQGCDRLAQLPDPPEWILLLACDMPRLDPVLLRAWIDQLHTHPAKIMALVPRTERGWDPMCAFYRLQVRTHLKNFLGRGGSAFQAWLQEVKVQSLFVDERIRPMLSNCNFPEDIWP